MNGSDGVIVQVTNPETPFGGVQVLLGDIPVLVCFNQGGGGGGGGPGGPSVPMTTDLLAGDGLGGVVDSGIPVSRVVQKQPTYPTPATINQVIQCLQAAGLCA